MPTPRKPTQLKILQGNPGKRRLPREPKPAPLAPPCPSWFDESAKREWHSIVPELDKLGILARIDAAVLEGYCAARARWREAELHLQDHPDDWRVSIQADRLLNVIKAYFNELGASPAARSRVQAPQAVSNDDGMSALLS